MRPTKKKLSRSAPGSALFPPLFPPFLKLVKLMCAVLAFGGDVLAYCTLIVPESSQKFVSVSLIRSSHGRTCVLATRALVVGNGPPRAESCADQDAHTSYGCGLWGIRGNMISKTAAAEVNSETMEDISKHLLRSSIDD